MRSIPAAATAALLLFLAACGGNPLSGLPACGPDISLAALPLDEADFTSIIPLGNLSPTSHTFPTEHHYFVLNRDPDHSDRALRAPVYAMQDGWVVTVSSVEHVEPGFTDYDLTLGVCADFSIGYGHLSRLSDELRAALGAPTHCETYVTDGTTYKRCSYAARVAVSVGQLLGEAGGNPDQYALDVGAKDFRRQQNSFANEQRYRNDASYLLYVVSPLAYLGPAPGAVADSRMGGWNDEPRTLEPLYGEIAYDVAGTAMGNWFREGEDFYPEDPHLALAKDNVDPSQYAISIGTSLGSMAGYVVLFEPEHSGFVDRAFEEITDENIYCYPSQRPGSSAPAGRILIRLEGTASLLAEFQEGTGCEEPLAFANPRLFNR